MQNTDLLNKLDCTFGTILSGFIPNLSKGRKPIVLNIWLFVLRFHTYFSSTQHGVSWRWLLTIWGVGGQQYDRPPLSLTIQTDHKFKCYNIVGDKHTDLVDDRNVLHRNGRIIQNIVRLDFKFFLLLCMTNVNWCEEDGFWVVSASTIILVSDIFDKLGRNWVR